jgi:oligoendopeptidase F
MQKVLTTIRQREYLPVDFNFQQWEDLKPYLNDLSNRTIGNTAELQTWFVNRSELESFISENFAWRYIRMTCDTANQEAQQAYQFFLTEINPHIAPYDDVFNKKALESPYLSELTATGFDITIRGMKRAVEIFREENIPLQVEIQQLSSEYQAAIGAMTVEVNGETKTLQQAAAWLESPDRLAREKVYHTIQQRRLQDHQKLDDLLINSVPNANR